MSGVENMVKVRARILFAVNGSKVVIKFKSIPSLVIKSTILHNSEKRHPKVFNETFFQS